MKVLVVGSGGREHALVWKITQSSRVSKVYVAPGNAGTALMAENVAINALDLESLLQFAKEKKVDLTVVGPDDALANGIVDLFQKNNLRIFGPSASAARLESSKSFAKDFMRRHGIPAARSEEFEKSADAHQYCQSLRYPLVIKADGLALGKGVIIAEHPLAAAEAIYRIMDKKIFGEAGNKIVIEEYLQGTECSIHAFVDGKSWLLCPDCKDHKRAFDGDQGPNTGGMGTISPSGVVDSAMLRRIKEEILDRFVAGIQADQLEFRGMLFPGLMITSDGPKVLEFNSRFGDPETQVLMRRLESDLIDLLDKTINGQLANAQPVWFDQAAICVILASGGYPGSYEKGKEITGLAEATQMKDVVLFHAGTQAEASTPVTNGGRVLGVTAIEKNVTKAREMAYKAIEQIHFENMFFRKDIGELKTLEPAF